MNVRATAGADEAYAIGLLQEIAAMCDETRRTSSGDPSRIDLMLDAFEEMLATLAPVLEKIGRSPTASRDEVLSAAEQTSNSHQSLVDAMSLELERLGQAIVDSDRGASASSAYTNAGLSIARTAIDVNG